MSSDKDNNNDNHSKKALIIAVSDYDTYSGLKSIQFCKNDGQEIYNVLEKNGYDIPECRKLIGYVDSQSLKNTIYGFFTDESNKPDDTLIFYYSGHGVPDKWGKTFLAPSDMNADHPRMMGFSFDDLTDSMLECNSLRVVTILDSCFSGSLKISKGLGLDSKSGEEATTRIANSSIEEKSEKLKQGVGRCLLAASQGYEEAYNRQEKDHSIFTYYLLEGLKGHKNAVDDEGNVTYDTLGKFITREIGNLPLEKRPKQTPVRKGEVAGGEIVLASYPELRKTNESDYYVLVGKGEDYYRLGKYEEALEYIDQILILQPKNEYALLRKGNILLHLNHEKKALEYFDHVIKLSNNNSDAWYYKAKTYVIIKDYENAIQCLEEASNINPNDEKVVEAYRKVKLLIKPSEQISYNEISIPSLEETQQKSSTLNNIISLNKKGSSLLQQNLYKEAIDLYDKLLKLDPNNIDALNNKGTALFKLYSYQEAIKCYDQVLKLEQNNESARYNRFLALQHISTQKLSNKSEEIIQNKKKSSSDNKSLSSQDLSFNLGKYENEVEHQEKKLNINTDDIGIIKNKDYDSEHILNYCVGSISYTGLKLVAVSSAILTTKRIIFIPSDIQYIINKINQNKLSSEYLFEEIEKTFKNKFNKGNEIRLNEINKIKLEKGTVFKSSSLQVILRSGTKIIANSKDHLFFIFLESIKSNFPHLPYDY